MSISKVDETETAGGDRWALIIPNGGLADLIAGLRGDRDHLWIPDGPEADCEAGQ